MNRMFRRYHRQIAIVLCLPLFLTVLTGMGYTIAHEWLHQNEFGEFLLGLHTLEILHLEAIYPILNGLGLIGLLITGLSMTGLFRTRA
ncbi:peptidase [Nostocaceae cyanobacterium CENA369]|uniref:Peptidase n=1 Tax=Dendronalium phyllosphericum CENA369 TaxID=1725256 RepID=A0A8J7I4Y3_9NOST|nr:peptidase [Dendronalium phyllosphericum]MBH8573605.1 peptidase [Dendronalium phyllosphericum CENA369]